jgi:hypothetical protein
MREDNLGFPTGVMLVAFGYTVIWAVASWSYSRGYEAARCTKRHGYQFSETVFMRESK